MAYPELIEALRKECEAKARNIWEAAEAEAGRVKEETSSRLEKLTREHDRDVSSAGRTKSETILSEAGRTARALRLTAEQDLTARLYRTATAALHLLRDGRYEDTFGSLARELGPGTWETVKVRPEDGGIAKICFPDSEIVEDGSITGGFEAVTDGGRVRVVNTFEKRLERAWAEMLPEIMKDVYKSLG